MFCTKARRWRRCPSEGGGEHRYQGSRDQGCFAEYAQHVRRGSCLSLGWLPGVSLSLQSNLHKLFLPFTKPFCIVLECGHKAKEHEPLADENVCRIRGFSQRPVRVCIATAGRIVENDGVEWICGLKCCETTRCLAIHKRRRADASLLRAPALNKRGQHVRSDFTSNLWLRDTCRGTWPRRYDMEVGSGTGFLRQFAGCERTILPHPHVAMFYCGSCSVTRMRNISHRRATKPGVASILFGRSDQREARGSTCSVLSMHGCGCLLWSVC